MYHHGLGEFAYRNDQFHIGYLLWELEKLPKEHHLALELLDEIWVPTSFVANVYRTFGQENVHIVGKGIPELGRASALPRLITENDPFTALICFDFHSSVERKNPLCAVRAFLEAFPLQQFQDCRRIKRRRSSRLLVARWRFL